MTLIPDEKTVVKTKVKISSNFIHESLYDIKSKKMDVWSVRWEGIRITGMSVLEFVSVHWKSILNKFIEKLDFTDDNFFFVFSV